MVFATFGHGHFAFCMVLATFGNKWSSSTKRMLDLAFYKVTPSFFLMPRIRLYKMLFHLICLKTSVLYKMLVGKYRFQKDVCSLQSGGEQGQFFLHFEARKRHCTGGQPTPKGRGNLNPHYIGIYIHMYICMYVCKHICKYIIHLYTYTFIITYVHIYIYMLYIYQSTHLRIYISTHKHINT